MTTTSKHTAPAAAGTTTEFHYVTTVQTSKGVLNTRDGLLTVPAGYTRRDCFHHLMSQLREEYGDPLSVLYFALEPNHL
ncbi:hypothetical protein G5C51_08145 [Streptomyces sp. A7024]|uniref:Uncharacterized protein n=1 Tax=Streptomyces coryli TaxID=1128680 RepID=A0A6G4TXV6_9ACTN|nr:hypothetical protein [Streptomyces coryli]NGN63877.1 hypothetical protein [Streptomyces coryli]